MEHRDNELNVLERIQFSNAQANQADDAKKFALFQQATKDMIATNDRAYDSLAKRWSVPVREYTKEEIKRIIDSGSITSQKKLSRDFFDRDGFYKRIIVYYATLMKYVGLLIPNVSYGQKMTSEPIKKKYFNAINYVEKMNLQSLFVNCSLKALVEGCYYGVIQKADKNTFSVLDLPSDYCRTNFKDSKGNDIIEFNVQYFKNISSAVDRENCLKVYPKAISKYYKKYERNQVNTPWVYVPVEIGVCFPMFDNGKPFFLSALPAIVDYDDAVEVEKAGQIEKIKKIIVQKIPHLSDGTLLFEPEEAAVMHEGSVRMMASNEYVSVLTTYADVDSIVSKTAAEAQSNNIEKMVTNIFNEVGVSGELFASNSNLALQYSLKNDMSFMLVLVNKYANFVTNIINSLYSNSNINFKYTILPITHYNEKEFLEMAFKLAGSGYSLLLPALTLGMSQRDIISIKDLENDLLKLTEKLQPPQSAYTQSAKGQEQKGSGKNPEVEDEESKPGAPQKEADQKAEKTEQNKEALEKQGMNK